jgi:hypothetical protein
MSNQNRGKTANEIRLKHVGENKADAKTTGSQISNTKPRSLSMNASLIWANAIGEVEARAITAAWAPKFRITLVDTLPEHRGWE